MVLRGENGEKRKEKEKERRKKGVGVEWSEREGGKKRIKKLREK
jgi:hypothetical protein